MTHSSICATMLVGPGSGAILRDAVKSAHAMGLEVLPVFWGATEEDQRITWRALEEGGQNVDGTAFETHTGGADFAAARNRALSVARRAGFGWAVTLDTDERLHGTFNVGHRFPRTVPPIMHAEDPENQYKKPRILSTELPNPWRGRVHEFVEGEKTEAYVIHKDVLHFTELRKTPEQAEMKLRRDLEALEAACDENPNDGRWHFYRGESFAALYSLHGNVGDRACAINAYASCINAQKTTGEFPEEAGWAGFKGAWIAAEWNTSVALSMLRRGQRIAPWLPELPWYAAFLLSGENPRASLAWAVQAIGLGLVEGVGRAFPRVAFAEWVAHYEGPYQLAAVACDRLGRESDRDTFLHKADVARRIRLG